MRLLFLALVLANVAFFAWSRYDSPEAAAPQGNRLARQIAPDKLTIVAPGGCLEWGSFTLADSARAEKALEPLGLGSRLAQRRTQEAAGWWIYVPPQGSRQAALRVAGELKALGVQDYFILADEGELRWALSLGVYRTEEAAQARLAALGAMGVRNALITRRETVVPKVWLQVKGTDPALEARLKDIARQIEGSELRACS